MRKLATLLRVADALDRSHAQPIESLRASAAGGRIALQLVARGPADLELWDVAHEAQLFRKVFGAKLAFATSSARKKKRV